MSMPDQNNQELPVETNSNEGWRVRDVLSEAWKVTQTKGVKLGIWRICFIGITVYLVLTIAAFLTVDALNSLLKTDVEENKLFMTFYSIYFILLPIFAALTLAFILIKNIEVIKKGTTNYDDFFEELEKYITHSPMFFVVCIPYYLLIYKSIPYSLSSVKAFVLVSIVCLLGIIIVYTFINIFMNDIKDFKNIVNRSLICLKVILKHALSYITLIVTAILLGLLASLLLIMPSYFMPSSGSTLEIVQITYFWATICIPTIWIVPFILCVLSVIYTKENFDQ
ncbi:MAG: hypothetical protein ACOX2O_06990 [Bdellovibrionota bacterium]|jgi:hypothetical protein